MENGLSFGVASLDKQDLLDSSRCSDRSYQGRFLSMKVRHDPVQVTGNAAMTIISMISIRVTCYKHVKIPY